MTSSMITTVCPGEIASACISNSSCFTRSATTQFKPFTAARRNNQKKSEYARTVPYSFSNVAHTHFPGSFPRLRTGTKAAPSLSAITGPNRKPRASSPTITSIFLLGEFAIVSDTRRWVRWVIRPSKINGSRKSGKMSQNATP
jgi:hypothetical protein